MNSFIFKTIKVFLF